MTEIPVSFSFDNAILYCHLKIHWRQVLCLIFRFCNSSIYEGSRFSASSWISVKLQRQRSCCLVTTSSTTGKIRSSLGRRIVAAIDVPTSKPCDRNAIPADIEYIERIPPDRTNHWPRTIRCGPVGCTIVAMARIERYIKRLCLFPEQTRLSGFGPCFPRYYYRPRR